MTNQKEPKLIDDQLKPNSKAKTSSAENVNPGRLTAAEESIVYKLSEQIKAAVPLPKLKKSEKGTSVMLDYPNKAIGWGLLMNALGSTNFDFVAGINTQLAMISSVNGEIQEANLNFALSVIAGMKPNDQDEAMLGVLKAASYLCAVRMAGHLHNAQTTVEVDNAGRAFNKCARTFAVLTETLSRKRSGSQQTVTVQNVSVRDNAQAVVTGPRSKGPPKTA